MKPYGPPRPLRSQGVPTLRGNILTDARILRYIMKGFYGPEKQAEALAILKEPIKHKPEPTASDYLSDLFL